MSPEGHAPGAETRAEKQRATRKMTVCPRCQAPLRQDQGETVAARLSRHAAVGACRPFVAKDRKPKATEPRSNIRSTLGEGWDA